MSYKYRLKEIRLAKNTLSELFKYSSDAGYFIISAFSGGDGSSDILNSNLEKSRSLKSDIRAAGYAFIPVWGDFIEDAENEDKTIKEQAFIVFNFVKRIKQEDSEELYKLGLELCRKYEQEAIIYKPIGEDRTAHYVGSDGTTIATFSTASPATSADVYFTNLNKSREKDSGRAFAYREGHVYLAKYSETVAEAYLRPGEIYFRIRDDLS